MKHLMNNSYNFLLVIYTIICLVAFPINMFSQESSSIGTVTETISPLIQSNIKNNSLDVNEDDEIKAFLEELDNSDLKVLNLTEKVIISEEIIFNEDNITGGINVFNEGDVTYPSVRLISPENEIYNSRIKIEVETEDPEGIKSVEYKIDEGDWKSMDSESSNIFRDYWTPMSDGWHSLTVRSTDNQDYTTNFSSSFETDSNPPYIILNSNT